LIDDIYGGRIAPKKVQPVQVPALPPSQEGSLKASNGNKTTLRLVNMTAEPVKVYWLDGEGKRKPYGQIEAYGRQLQNTYVSHPFILTDKNDQGLVIFVAVPGAGVGTLRR
jgi:hypothetical protein